MAKWFYTVCILTKLNTLRFFRDRVALFFGILFPVVFLVIFGLISRGGGDVSFRIAVIDQSGTFVGAHTQEKLTSPKVFKIDKEIKTLEQAEEKLTRNQLDSIILLTEGFGRQTGPGTFEGKAQVIYTPNNVQAGTTIASVLDEQFDMVNSMFVETKMPFTVEAKPAKSASLEPFDYTFAGILGFAIVGLGIFGPMSVFPELKKLGILRRLRTTPLKVPQYFLATMLSQAIIGLVAVAIMFAVAILAFELQVAGNFAEIALFTAISVMLILGIGLAIGGWARNERQAAPLGQLIVFPLLFLSGTFFPRFVLPEWLQKVSDYLPLTPVIDGLRMLTAEGKHLIDLGPQLGLMALWAIVIYAVAFKLFRWE